MSKLLSNATYDMGSFFYEEGLEKPFQFNFDNLSNFHYIHLGCGACTSITEIDKVTNSIKGVINIDSAIGDLKKSVGDHVINKYLYVKFDPEKHEFIADEIGKKVFNQECTMVHLTVKFLVRVIDLKGS